MPLRQTRYGGECPLGVFKVDVPSGGGCHDADPLEACFGNPELTIPSCRYFRFPREGETFDPAVQCMCPADMTRGESRVLVREYTSLVKQGRSAKTKEGFWNFVEKSHRCPAVS